MNALVLLVIGLVVLGLGYVFYSKIIAGMLGLKSTQDTPAHTMRDGVDYVPAKKPILMGHHFASIAGAAPIIGPVLAAQYGWLPVFIWVLLGGVFLGAVHDFTSLVASVRHEGRSIGVIIERYLGNTGKVLFLIFAWATLVLVIAVFTLVVSATFVRTPAVATASILFMILAIGFGVAVYRYHVNFIAASVVGVILLGAFLYLGVLYPFPRLFPMGADGNDPMLLFWQLVLVVYIFIASVTPVNILLQPRDYLNSFLLYGILLLSLVALLVAPPMLEGARFTSFAPEGMGPLFPLLFVTVACGAISGFHSMVASGTTAKQLDRESDARAVGYGAMLIESLLAVLALITAVMVSKQEYFSLLKPDGAAKANPVNVFNHGIASLLSNLSIPEALGIGFAGLAVSAFALTSLDTATRLGRFSLQELFMKRGAKKGGNIISGNRFVATALTVSVAALLLVSGKTMTLWRLFGASNQLLAAMALMAVTVWLAASGRKTIYTVIPMVFMFVVTLAALLMQIKGFAAGGNYVLAAIAVLLFVLALLLAYNYVKSRRSGVAHENGAAP